MTICTYLYVRLSCSEMHPSVNFIRACEMKDKEDSMNAAKWIVAMALTAVVAIGFADLAVAGKKKVSGQDLYKEYCKPCHQQDSENGEYTPMTLIQDQWQRFFDEKYEPTHSTVKDPNHGDLVVTEAITAEDLETLKEWTIDHAADSEHPMTCG